MNIIQTAKALTEKGYSVIPVNSRKNPTCPTWGRFQTAPVPIHEVESLFENAWGIALLTGGPSRVFLIDVDCKYDLTGTLWEDLKNAIPKELLTKAYVQSTMNGGFHMAFIIPAEKVEPNSKYASRYTTAYEKNTTYQEAFKSPETRDKALKIALQDNSRVLIESRGGSSSVVCGGYFLLPPSPGYKYIYGKLTEISADEYDSLVSICRSFNEVVKVDTKQESFSSGEWDLSPFEHFNREGDAAQLLLDSGWIVINESAGQIRFKRPGQVGSASSALYDKETKVFNCFSTSTSFESNKGYNPVGVLSILEFDEDFSQTFSYLVKAGWGIKK